MRLGWTGWLLGVAAAAAAAAGDTNVVVAPPAKNFKLTTVTGQRIHLADFARQPVLLLFWATWDEPSRKQVDALRPVVAQFGSNSVAVVGIALDEKGPAAVREFVRAKDVPFPVAMITYDVLQDYGGVTAIPTLVLLDRNHNIIRRYVGVTDTKTLTDDLAWILKSEPAQ